LVCLKHYANIGKKFATPFITMWIYKDFFCLCQRWEVKFGYHDNYFEIDCEMGVVESFQGTCFGHAFSKTYQYATIIKKM
jgi:hypothetical protein